MKGWNSVLIGEVASRSGVSTSHLIVDTYILIWRYNGLGSSWRSLPMKQAALLGNHPKMLQKMTRSGTVPGQRFGDHKANG